MKQLRFYETKLLNHDWKHTNLSYLLLALGLKLNEFYRITFPNTNLRYLLLALGLNPRPPIPSASYTPPYTFGLLGLYPRPLIP